MPWQKPEHGCDAVGDAVVGFAVGKGVGANVGTGGPVDTAKVGVAVGLGLGVAGVAVGFPVVGLVGVANSLRYTHQLGFGA